MSRAIADGQAISAVSGGGSADFRFGNGNDGVGSIAGTVDVAGETNYTTLDVTGRISPPAKRKLVIRSQGLIQVLGTGSIDGDGRGFPGGAGGAGADDTVFGTPGTPGALAQGAGFAITQGGAGGGGGGGNTAAGPQPGTNGGTGASGGLRPDQATTLFIQGGVTALGFVNGPSTSLALPAWTGAEVAAVDDDVLRFSAVGFQDAAGGGGTPVTVLFGGVLIFTSGTSGSAPMPFRLDVLVRRLTATTFEATTTLVGDLAGGPGSKTVFFPSGALPGGWAAAQSLTVAVSGGASDVQEVTGSYYRFTPLQGQANLGGQGGVAGAAAGVAQPITAIDPAVKLGLLDNVFSGRNRYIGGGGGGGGAGGGHGSTSVVSDALPGVGGPLGSQSAGGSGVGGAGTAATLPSNSGIMGGAGAGGGAGGAGGGNVEVWAGNGITVDPGAKISVNGAASGAGATSPIHGGGSGYGGNSGSGGGGGGGLVTVAYKGPTVGIPARVFATGGGAALAGSHPSNSDGSQGTVGEPGYIGIFQLD